MNKFDSLDSFSYQCGVIDAFNEVVKAGVKRIALSHPTDTLAECQALIPFSEQICRQYGNHFYVEEEPLLTDLFPVSINRGKFNILYYRDERDIQLYLSLKEEKKPITINAMHWTSRQHPLIGQKSLIFPIPLLMVVAWKHPRDWCALGE